jgi:hypothetical protein
MAKLAENGEALAISVNTGLLASRAQLGSGLKNFLNARITSNDQATLMVGNYTNFPRIPTIKVAANPTNTR